jgi:hypothetical protein
MNSDKIIWLESFDSLDIKPGDTIIVKHGGVMLSAEVDRLGQAFKKLYPDNKLIIVRNDIDLGVLRANDSE